MRGDILIIGNHHRRAAEGIVRHILPGIINKEGKFFITIAGESGAGKSEIDYALEGMLEKLKIKSHIIQQDDYFVFPPKTNERMRIIDINRVGPQEVKLDLLNENISELLSGKTMIVKPLVIFEEYRITT